MSKRTPATGRRVARVVAVILIVGSATAVLAQRGMRGAPIQELSIHNSPYDGRFMFARLSFTTGPGGYYYFGLPAWAHGYPKAETNLMRIMREVTALKPHVDSSNVFAMDDPELTKFPIAYMAEPDYWTMNDKEAMGLRAYLLKGGFLIFDDFRDDFRNSGRGWQNFEEQMARVIPGARFIDLDPSNPIFHAFFEIKSFDILPQAYDRGPPVLRGLFEDNDPSKRMIAIINFNTDVSQYWEFSGDGFMPVELSNEAYELGVNYVVYGLTH
jgi:hypothetical protein